MKMFRFYPPKGEIFISEMEAFPVHELFLNAFFGSFFVALLAGILGWMMLLRGQAFAAHALPDIGFSGASVALVFGVNPIFGLLLASLGGAWVMEAFSFYEKKSDLSVDRNASDRLTGLVLAGSLALGMGVLEAFHASESDTIELLFGGLMHLSLETLWLLAGMSLFCLIGLLFLYRPLLFSALAPEMAIVRGANTWWVGMGFMTLAALGCAVCAEIAGALLAFSLIIGPASAAFVLNLSPLKGMIFSAIVALILSWGGIALYGLTGLPPAFWIGLGAVLSYLIGIFLRRYFGEKPEFVA
ncbi:metal ABC transporter permease [Acetobacteraceae bacterium]|nr:metal ABC transporter permease [Acetobacteraceae bacterium]